MIGTSMQRFIFSIFSAFLVAAAVAPTAQALPDVDPDFTVQTLRLREFDTRNKSDDNQQSYYPQTAPSTQAWPQNAADEQDSTQTTEPTVWENPDTQEEGATPVLSVIERRHQSLDRN